MHRQLDTTGAVSQRLLIVGMVVILTAVALTGWLLTGRDPVAPPRANEVPQPQGVVLLVPGYGGGTARLEPLAEALAKAGIRSRFVDIGTGTGDLHSYAREVEALATQQLDRGLPAPDVVGYSAGGLIARLAADAAPQDFRKVVTLASPHHGTSTADLGAAFGDCPTACQQMRPDSELIASLPDPAHPQSWLSVWSTSDDVIRPPESSEVHGVRSYPLQSACAGDVDHGTVPTSTQTQSVVLAFLQGRELPVTCVAG